MAAYYSSKSFMHFLMTQDIFLSNKTSTSQHFILDQYAKIIFQNIIFDGGTAKVSIARKSQFQVLQRERPKIKLDIIHVNKTTIFFESDIVFNLIGTV